MKSELIVDVQAQDVTIALLEDGRLVSLQKEARNIAYAVGDIYLAKVKKLMPGLNAAFVNVGYEKDAFLHYLDLGAHFDTYAEYLKQLMADKKRVPQLPKMKLLPEIDKHGSVSQAIAPGQELLVQIVKEPISSKGPRLTTELTFTGRYLVLTPFCDKISISQKIKSSEEKVRLRQLIEFIKPRNFGVIVRTSAEGKKSAELDNELKTLVQSFYDACAKAQRSTAPTLVFEEENRVVGMLRDVFSPSYEAIYVNDSETYEQIRKYVSLIAPDRTDIVKLYTKDTPIFDHFSITRQIKSSFGKTVSFKSGAYIIIEHTEALHVIDVNSGNRAKATNDQESNALEVNLRAADEIARQLRLRDMGGIIVVDFIDMTKSEHRQQLFEHMREIMANDRARHNILPLSKFGLMQITRQRVRPVLDIHVAEQCPSCLGKGEVQPSILFTDTLFEKLEYIVETLGKRNFVMYVHPYVEAYIKKGLFTSMYGKWRRTLGRCFKIMADQSLAYLQYRVIDSEGRELNLVQEKDNGRSTAAKTAARVNKRDSEPAEPQESQKTKAESKKAKAQQKPEAAPQQPKAERTKPEAAQQPKAERTKPEAAPQQPKAERTKPEAAQQPKAERTKPEAAPQQPKAERTKPEAAPQQPKAERTKPEAAPQQPKAERTKPEAAPQQPKAERTKPEAAPQQPKAERTKPEAAPQQPKAERTKPEAAPQQPKAERTKPEQTDLTVSEQTEALTGVAADNEQDVKLLAEKSSITETADDATLSQDMQQSNAQNVDAELPAEESDNADTDSAEEVSTEDETTGKSRSSRSRSRSRRRRRKPEGSQTQGSAEETSSDIAEQ